jgi:hypothetical protein
LGAGSVVVVGTGTLVVDGVMVVIVVVVVVVVGALVVVVGAPVVVDAGTVVVVGSRVVLVRGVVVVVTGTVVAGDPPSIVNTLLSVNPLPCSTTSIFHLPGGADTTSMHTAPLAGTSVIVPGP